MLIVADAKCYLYAFYAECRYAERRGAIVTSSRWMKVDWAVCPSWLG
jgi:hypothetical protein